MTVLQADTYLVLSVNLQLCQLFFDLSLEPFESRVYMCVRSSNCLYIVSL